MGYLQRKRPQRVALLADDESIISGVICRTWVFWVQKERGAMKTILVVNRGEIACRVIQAAKDEGIKPSPSIVRLMQIVHLWTWLTRRSH